MTSRPASSGVPREAGRQIDPLGTASRVVGGTIAIVLPIALHGLDLPEAVIAFVALPLIAALAAPLIAALFRRLAPGALASRWICSAPGCSLIAVMVGANGALVAPTSANGNVTIWVWLGASMLLAAARGYGGCEVLAVPNLTGRRDQTGCLLHTPIDRQGTGRDESPRGGSYS